MALRQALVTGAYGFIGRHVARQLAAQGYLVCGIGHGSWDRAEWQRWGLAQWYSCDISLDTLAAHAGEPEVIIHCAGSGTVGFSMHYPFQDYQRSVATTLEVLEFIRLYRPATRLVYPSSAGVYGLVQNVPIMVDTPLKPASPYGLHKRIAEDLCQSYCQHFKINAAIVRLFSVYGNGLRKQLLWDACHKILTGDVIFAGTGTETRDWLHVEDAAELLDIAARHAAPSCPIVNGGTGEGVSIREVISTLVQGFKTIQQPSFSGSVRPGDPLHYVAGIDEARAWGWSARRSWSAEMAAYVSWFRQGAP